MHLLWRYPSIETCTDCNIDSLTEKDIVACSALHFSLFLISFLRFSEHRTLSWFLCFMSIASKMIFILNCFNDYSPQRNWQKSTFFFQKNPAALLLT